MDYVYVAIDDNGKRHKGFIEANSEKELLDYLQRANLKPLKISRKSASLLPTLSIFKKVKSSDIVIFTRQLSSMVLTGLTLIESLNILRKQTSKPEFEKVIDNIISSISEGNTFSDALSEHKEIFSDVYIALIRAAEAGGLLDKVLERLADNLEKAEDLRKKIKSALFYPAIVMGGVVVVILVMNLYVIPQLSTLYTQMDIEIPLTTQIVLGFSKLITNFFPVLIIMAFVGVIFFNRFKRTDTGRRTLDRLILRLPVIGQIITLSVLDEISRTLSILISSGTSILEALTITANVANNIWYKDAVLHSASMVEKGIPLSKALQSQNIFPITLIQMAKVGESTGKIDESFLKVAEYYERDLDVKIKNLTTAIEPIVIIFLGVVIGFLILAIITPIYSLISKVQ